MSDLDDYLLEHGVPTNTWSVGRPTYDLEYADETLLINGLDTRTNATVSFRSRAYSRGLRYEIE